MRSFEGMLLRTFFTAVFVLWMGYPAPAGEESIPGTIPAAEGGGRDLSYAPYTFAPSLDEFARIWEKLDFFGDIRMRYEVDFNRNKALDPLGKPSDDDRHRGRMRLRFGLRYPFLDSLLFETGLRTRNEENDPRDDDLDLGRLWSTGDVGLDLLNLTWSPQEVEGSWIKGGKFKHIFTANPVMGGLAWDPDLNPEGVAAGIVLESGNPVLESFRLAVGEYLSVEQDRADDVTTFSAQTTLGLALGEGVGGEIAIGYFGFSNPTPDGNTELVGLDEGNYLQNGEFASEFRIWDSYAALTFEVEEIPVVVSGEWIANPGARINQDHGWTAGLAVGALKESGDVRGFYQYQEIQQDAIFTPIARTDFARITNYEGSAAGVAWRFQDNMELEASVSWVKAIKESGVGFTEPRHESRFRLDLNIYF